MEFPDGTFSAEEEGEDPYEGIRTSFEEGSGPHSQESEDPDPNSHADAEGSRVNTPSSPEEDAGGEESGEEGGDEGNGPGCVPYIPRPQEMESGDESGEVWRVPSVHISQMRFCTRQEAAEFGHYVLEVLEEDLFHYYNSFDEEEDEVMTGVKLELNSSNASFDSNYSDPLPGDPSTMTLFYEYEPTTRRRPPWVQPLEGVDAETQVTIHRRKLHRPPGKEVGTMTREMTYVDSLTALLVFRHLYPQKDDYKPPGIPSRQESLDDVMLKAKEENPLVDAPWVGPKVRWSKVERILPPLPQDYFKEDTFWTGSVFKGQYLNREFTKGRFEYPLMSVYEGDFKEGHAETSKHMGCVTYPRGDKFEGEWVKGRHVTGTITFADDLKFEQHNWGYCTPPDRRFYIEKDVGIQEVGKTLFNDRFPAPLILPGHYDTGYGVFNPDTGVVRGYSGDKIRDASYAECKWIMSACRKVKKVEERYKPSFSEHRIPGSSIQNFHKQSQ